MIQVDFFLPYLGVARHEKVGMAPAISRPALAKVALSTVCAAPRSTLFTQGNSTASFFGFSLLLTCAQRADPVIPVSEKMIDK